LILLLSCLNQGARTRRRTGADNCKDVADLGDLFEIDPEFGSGNGDRLFVRELKDRRDVKQHGKPVSDEQVAAARGPG
jgi:hypothetical protein